jgi:hypothetical protein
MTERYKKRFNESGVGSNLYKMLGDVLKEMKKDDLSSMSKSEKSSIIDRLDEIKKSL